MNPIQQLHSDFVNGKISALEYARQLKAFGATTEEIKRNIAYATQTGAAKEITSQRESGIGTYGIQPGQHSDRAEEGPSYGHAMPSVPIPPRRIDVMGQNGGEDTTQGSPYVGPAYRSDEGSPYMGSPMRQPTSARVVQAARQVLPAAQAAPAQQPQPQQSESSGLMQLIRGDFREGADQRVMEAMRRQREESGIEGKAEGGATTKKSSRDDVLHKALEIIHHMLTRR